MPEIQVSTTIKKDKTIVYNVLKEMGRFPDFMKGVKRLDVINKNKTTLITSWQVEIDGANIIWKEEDNFNDEDMSLRFKMIDGDYDKYEGIWRLEEVRGATRISINADFEWGVPVFEKLVGDVLEQKARKGLRTMLLAIKKYLK